MPRYALSWANAADHLFDVTLTFTAPANDPRLALPAWRPGRYLIQNYAANVREWTAIDSAGAPRRIWKESKSVWRVEARTGDEIIVRYRFYAGVLDAGSSFLDFDEAYFNGSNLFMMVAGLRTEEHRLTVAAPRDWQIETQLPRDEGAASWPGDARVLETPGASDDVPAADAPADDALAFTHSFRARDYDHLIDSPAIAAKKMTRFSFTESGAIIHLVFVAESHLDVEQFIDPLRRIVRSQAGVFGSLPLSEYRFLIHIGDRWHGVEHEASSSIIARRSDLLGARAGDEGHDHFLAICSHEFFHLWNVKRIMPSRFAPYDYSAETPTELLWVMEGVTSYYGELTLVRSGLWTETRYIKHLNAGIETLESSPAQRHLPLSQASFDAWLQSDVHDRANAIVSFYNKGEIVAALLDLTILKATGGEKSLDDVMRVLWNERILSEDAMVRATAQVSDVGGFFDRYVYGTDALPYAELFQAAGVEFRSSARDDTAVGLGATFRMDNGRLLVAGVTSGGAAMEAGLLGGDELIAIDDMRTVSESDVRAVLRSLRDGDGVELMSSRAGVVRRVAVVVASDPRVTIKMSATGDNALRKQWLRRVG